MAKRKINVKSVARKAKAGAKKGLKGFNVMDTVKANIGGFGAAFIVDKLDDMEFITSMEKGGDFVAPAIVEGAGILLQMFGPESMKPVAFGLQGGAAALSYAPIMASLEEPDPNDPAANGTSSINATAARLQRISKEAIKRMGERRQRPGGQMMEMVPIDPPGSTQRVRDNAYEERRTNDNERKYSYLDNLC